MTIDANAKFLFDLEKRIEKLETAFTAQTEVLDKIMELFIKFQCPPPSPVNTGDQSTTEPRDSAATKTATPSRGDL